MALFFTRPAIRPQLVNALTDAYMAPEQNQANAQAQANQVANNVIGQAAGPVTPRLGTIVAAIVFLLVLGVFAYIAGVYQQTVAADNLWKAFQLVMGVIVGWLGGEAQAR